MRTGSHTISIFTSAPSVPRWTVMRSLAQPLDRGQYIG
jgi:hypothetical protein